MPKKPPKDAFFFYERHVQQREASEGRIYRKGMAFESWRTMTLQKREPFEKLAKDAKRGPRKTIKYTSQGVPLSQVTKKEQETVRVQKIMKESIEEIVRNSYINDTMATQEYYFIAGNFFCLRGNNKYYPAELALLKFTFENGIVQWFHTYINPEIIPLGYKFEAKRHAEETHQLPLPPDAKGEENYATILQQINEFLGNTSELPPLFTLTEYIPMIESFINEFCLKANENPNCYRVYPLHQLFFDIKEKSTNYIHGFESIHIATAHLNRDKYVYLRNTACNYHEEIDCSKFCALSLVKRWAYTFTDHICADLNIELIVGQHFPIEIDITAVNRNICNNTTDIESQITRSETASDFTHPQLDECDTTLTDGMNFSSLNISQNFVSHKKCIDAAERNFHDTWNTSSSPDQQEDGNTTILTDFTSLEQRRGTEYNESSFDSMSPYVRGRGRGRISSIFDFDSTSFRRGYGRGSELFRDSFNFKSLQGREQNKNFI